ncbi:hypothetical protein B0H13DRAFT_1920372 [Mycena leptocephala]|nr:hypothetical protein B0H13DRAFT_1920372 [Mycena leptocephala]
MFKYDRAKVWNNIIRDLGINVASGLATKEASHPSTSVNSEQASLKIKFIIVGGGLAGLACGYALRVSGHDTVVVDQHDMQEKDPVEVAGHGVVPRDTCDAMHRIRFVLFPWMNIEVSHDKGRTSGPAGFMKFYEQIMSDLDANFLIIQHDDLRCRLLTMCLDVGVVFKRGKAVDVSKSVDGMTVTLGDGEILRGDIVHVPFPPSNSASHCIPKVVGADGHNSFLTVWMGPGSCIIGTLDSKSDTFSISICSPTYLDSADGDMYESHDLSFLSPFDLSGYDPRLQKLVQLGRGCRPTVHKVFEQEDIIALNGSIVLVGDAAHSVLVEDAVTLGTLFSHLSDPKEIPIFAEIYVELRQRRTNETRISEYQSLAQISLAPGPQQEKRDTTLPLTLDQAFEDFENCTSSELLVQAWEQYLVVFSHDAGEAVDNWWSKWGFTLKQ